MQVSDKARKKGITQHGVLLHGVSYEDKKAVNLQAR